MRPKFLWLLPAALLLAAVIFAPDPARNPAPTVPATTCPGESPAPEPVTLPPETEAAAPAGFDRVPVYFQTDYPYIRYGNGTIGSSGCSITCLAMAASYLTDQTYTPDMMAWEFGSYGQTNIQRLEYGISQMQLPCEKNTDWRLTKQALQEGKIAIALMDARSEFTDSAHFVLLSGINEAGRYEVIDPFGPNYDKAYLAEGFEQGFTEGQILAGLEGCWVFDKAAMGPFRYEIRMPQFPELRYPGYRVDDRDVYTLACFVWAAGREEPPETQQALAELVLNRMMSDRYPDLVEDVLAQEELHIWYRQLNSAEPALEHYIAVTGALYGPHILPMEVVHGAPWPVGGGEEWGKLGSFTFFYERE